MRSKIQYWGPLVVSAALAAAALHAAAREPAAFAVLAALVLITSAFALRARRRVHEVLRSGDVRSVLATWSDGLARLPHPETMGPLVAAAAFASCGWVEKARTALQRSARGPAWDAALEHRLFVETLLDAFEGHSEAALSKAARLSSLPLPPAHPLTRTRIEGLREALAAFARAFAHRSAAGDADLLERAAKRSPLVHWALCYAAAVAAIDHGHPARARELLRAAPPWPEASVFRDFHDELSAVAAARLGETTPP